MKIDLRLPFAAVALALGACQGLDSGMGGMGGGGMMGPPVQQPGQIGGAQQQGGPAIGANGQPELTAPGATLAPNQVQFPVSQGPSGVKCPVVTQFGCALSFNIPTPAPGASGASPKPSPTASPSPSPSASGSGDDTGDAADATAPPAGTITLQLEPLPKDVPAMTNPDPRALRITSVSALRLQSDDDFGLHGSAAVTFLVPKQKVPGDSFAIQLYNEGAARGKRTDTYLGTYSQGSVVDSQTMAENSAISFTFPTPTVTVSRGQIWLLVLYGLQFPPGTTPTPAPTPSPSPTPSPNGSPHPSPSTTTSASPSH